MEFYGITKEDVIRLTEKEGNYYVLRLGSELEITSIKRNNCNNLLSSALSSFKKEDKLMIKYFPSNTVYFDIDFIDDDNEDFGSVSCSISKSEGKIVIGKLSKYDIRTGVLVLSGVLSGNGLIEYDRTIYYNSQFSSASVLSKVKILSVGLRGDNLLGLLFIPKERGFAVSADGSKDLAYSVKTWKLQDYSSWARVEIDSWFRNNKVSIIK